MAEIRHFENRHDVIFFLPRVVRFRYNGAEWHVDCGDMAEIKTKSRIPIWRTFGTLGEFNIMSSQSHLPHCRALPPGEFNVMIPELRDALQNAATGRIYSHDSRATCHVAGCCHMANSMTSFQSHVSRCRVGLLALGEFTVMIPEPWMPY